MNKYLQKVKSFFEKLSSKPEIGGLQITDSALQYVFLKKDSVSQPRAFSIKLPPGVVSGGKILDQEKFAGFLRQLREQIEPTKPNQRVRAVVSLPSAITYTQNCILPVNFGRYAPV